MDDYGKFVEKKFAELAYLDYLKGKNNALEKRESIMALVHPEEKEALDKFFRQIEKLGQKHAICLLLFIGKNGQALRMTAFVDRTDKPQGAKKERFKKTLEFHSKSLPDSPGTERFRTNPDEIVQITRSILPGVRVVMI